MTSSVVSTHASLCQRHFRRFHRSTTCLAWSCGQASGEASGPWFLVIVRHCHVMKFCLKRQRTPLFKITTKAPTGLAGQYSGGSPAPVQEKRKGEKKHSGYKSRQHCRRETKRAWEKVLSYNTVSERKPQRKGRALTSEHDGNFAIVCIFGRTHSVTDCCTCWSDGIRIGRSIKTRSWPSRQARLQRYPLLACPAI